MKRIPIIPGEYYHVYNRGVDKRIIFEEKADLRLFLSYFKKLNTKEALGGLRKMKFSKVRGSTSSEGGLVEIIAFCLNPNHFHLILSPLVDGGVQKFMQRIGTGYTMYFNEKYKRSGSLFQGKYKIKHIKTNEYLLYLGAYVNLNYVVHGYKEEDLYASSLMEYVSHETSKSFTTPAIIRDQYQSGEEYRLDALEVVRSIYQKRQDDLRFNDILLD
jgi:putative transposase